MTLSKISSVSKQQMLLAHGSKDTRIHDDTAEYKGITLREIAAMVDEPQSTEKADAAFFIPSTYRAHDGRSHAAQRENGSYCMLAIDIDEGNVDADTLQSAVDDIICNAASLTYSSAGATEDNKKWRVLIPLAEPLTGCEYADAQLALFDMLGRDYNIAADGALARSGQPIYLPNVPPAKRDDNGAPLFYSADKNRGEGYLVAKDSTIWAEVEFRRKNAEIAEAKAAADRARRIAARAEKRLQFPDNVDPIEAFNDTHTIADLFIQYGYERQGQSDSYKSPQSTTGSYPVKDFGTHWVSMSGSDLAAGVGTASAEFCWGDAFDLFAFYEHGGDITNAVRAYGAEIKPSRNDIRDNIMQGSSQHDQPAADDLDDFDIIPMTMAAEVEAPAVFQIGEATSRAKRNEIFWAKDAKPMLKSAYLVKNWLGAGQMSVVYGPSNVGKSFYALDMAFCVAAKMDWQGCKTRGGPVLYLATEGGNAFNNRVMALRKQYGIDDVQLAVRPSPVNLLDPAADLEGLLELCADIERTCGQKPCLIVVDTLSRALAGGDENGSVDMSSYIQNVDVLRLATGAHIMTVHHSGKDTSKGARGHSSLRAATDTEIELAVDGTIRTATATKQRDLEPQPPFMFSLKVHTLGQDEDGDDVTTCTITKASDEDAADTAQKRPTGANQKVVVKAFKQLRSEGRGHSNPTGAGWPESGQFWCIPADQLRDFAEGKMTSVNARSAYTQAIEALFAMGYMVQNEGLIWIAAKEGRVSK
jgi:hypothetical protein